MSKDPIGLAGGVSVYQYAPNPAGWVDPLGLARCPCDCLKKENPEGWDRTVEDRTEERPHRVLNLTICLLTALVHLRGAKVQQSRWLLETTSLRRVMVIKGMLAKNTGRRSRASWMKRIGVERWQWRFEMFDVSRHKSVIRESTMRLCRRCLRIQNAVDS
nr:hypothetical protein [Burkholderia plantarii]